MSSDLSIGTRKAIDAFARQIANENELGQDVYEELRGHVEDRMLEILGGESIVTEEEAFILVQKHFGDVLELKELLRGVHADASTLGFARCVIAIAIASLCIYSGLSLFIQLSTFGIIYWVPQELHQRAHQVLMVLSNGPLLVILLWLQTFRWRRALSLGRSHWVATIPLERMLRLLFFAALLYWLVPAAGGFPGFPHAARNEAVERQLIFISMLSAALMCVVWMRWCDTFPYSFRRVAVGGLAWFVFLLALGLFPPGTILHFPLIGSDVTFVRGGWELFAGTLPGTRYGVTWFYPLPFDWALVSVLTGFGGFYAVYAISALLLYVAVFRRFPLRPRM